ncbi:hypothetical protein VTN96DRAFT_1745 [Rasamsonia emersonii]
MESRTPSCTVCKTEKYCNSYRGWVSELVGDTLLRRHTQKTLTGMQMLIWTPMYPSMTQRLRLGLLYSTQNVGMFCVRGSLMMPTATALLQRHL